MRIHVPIHVQMEWEQNKSAILGNRPRHREWPSHCRRGSSDRGCGRMVGGQAKSKIDRGSEKNDDDCTAEASAPGCPQRQQRRDDEKNQPAFLAQCGEKECATGRGREGDDTAARRREVAAEEQVTTGKAKQG